MLPSFLDLSAIYGKNDEQARALREHKKGLMKTSGIELLSTDKDGFYVSGDDRVNENRYVIHFTLTLTLTRFLLENQQTLTCTEKFQSSHCDAYTI